MIEILVETRTIYRSAVGRKARLRKRTAYLDASWQAWRAKYPCGCEAETGYRCAIHSFPYSTEEQRAVEAGEMSRAEASIAQVEFNERRRKVIDRLARWLMWRDRTQMKRAGGAR